MSVNQSGLENLEQRLLLSATPLNLDDVAPQSSLVRSSLEIIDTFTAPSQTDTYEVILEPGETLTVQVAAVDPTLLASVTVTPQSGSPVTVTADSASMPAIVQTLVASAGTYTIDVSNVSGFGDYTVQAVANSAVEVEEAGGRTTTRWARLSRSMRRSPRCPGA